MNMEIQVLFTILLFSGLMRDVHSRVFTIKNNCPFNIAPATLTGSGAFLSTVFELEPHGSKTLNISARWSGRVWARFQCSNNGGMFSCKSGDCGSGRIECNGRSGAPPTTLVEFVLSDGSGKDYYDVSLVDGFNLPVSVVSQGGCPDTGCPVDVNAKCPSELAVKDGSGGTIGCRSACLTFDKPEECCYGDYGAATKCPPTGYSRFFKKLCPKTYSYVYDDVSSTFTCNTGPSYVITFCP